MSVTEVHAAPRWRPIALWIVKIILAIAFVSAGGAKLVGVPMLVESFHTLGLGQWFRYLTGALEVIGAVLILVPAWSGLGAILLCCIMVGATLAHLTVVPGSALPAVVLFVLGAIVAFAERDRLQAIAGAAHR
jgi:putative oxidoreductase